MADFQRTIADWMGVSLRTVRRWCERGELPGAYATKGGHWRIRRPSKVKLDALCASGRIKVPRGESFGERLAGAIHCATRTKAERERFKPLAARMAAIARKIQLHRNSPAETRVAELFRSKPAAYWMKAAENFETALDFTRKAHCARLRISEDTLYSGRLRLIDPQLAEILNNCPVEKFISPGAMKAAVKKPNETRLITAAVSIANRRGRVSAVAVAREMKMPRATFYRKFTARQIREAIAATRIGNVGVFAESPLDLRAKKNGLVIVREA